MEAQLALLLVDIQNDFCTGGSLAVPGSDQIIPACNAYLELFTTYNLPVFISRDWHPAKTIHFQEYGGIWPEHCVQNTKGAEFHPDLSIPFDATIISKGQDPREGSYSAFQGTGPDGRMLEELLKELDISELYIGGLPTDFCIRHTVLDGLHKGFSVKLLVDAIKGTDRFLFFSDDSARSIELMKRYGAVTAEFAEVKNSVITGPLETARQYR